MNAGHGQRLALRSAVADLEGVSFGDMRGRYRYACLDRQSLIHFPLGHAGESLENCCPRDRNTKLTEVPGNDLTLDGLAVDENAVAIENDHRRVGHRVSTIASSRHVLAEQPAVVIDHCEV